MRGNGLLAIRIHTIGSLHSPATASGDNPFDCLAFTVDNNSMRFKEIMTSGWQPARDVGTMALSDVVYNLGERTNHTFATMFPIYDWELDKGYNNLGSWIESAAKQAGR